MFGAQIVVVGEPQMAMFARFCDGATPTTRTNVIERLRHLSCTRIGATFCWFLMCFEVFGTFVGVMAPGKGSPQRA